MSKLQLLISQEQIKERIEELAAQITDHYKSQKEPLVVVCILKGAFIFFADLVRKLGITPELDFLRLASYGDSSAPGESIYCTKDLETEIQGKNVLLVEDIVDTGHSMDYVHNMLELKKPKSISICALIYKTERQEIEVKVDFCGFKLEKGFVVGYGLDFAEQYRNLDSIYELDLQSE